MKLKNILITGGCGYFGNILMRKLIYNGYNVKCLDLLIYGEESIKSLSNNKNFTLIHGDIRDEKKVNESLKNIDAVVHLAAIVGDKPCEAAPAAAYDINFNGTRKLYQLSLKNKISRFIFASTCSNYGISSDTLANENSKLNPVSLYAESKIDCENFLESQAKTNTKAISLRFGTAYGISQRTRFDLTVNSLGYEAYKLKKISVFAENTWRPYIHVDDMSNIVLEILGKDNIKNNFEKYNAGFTKENFTKRQIVEKLVYLLPFLEVEYIPYDNDRRNYKVDFSKIEKFLNLKNQYSVIDGFREILSALETKQLDDNSYLNFNLEALTRFFQKNSKKLIYK